MKNGDRIIIMGIPEDYHYRDLYKTGDRFEGVIDEMKEWGGDSEKVHFFTGYVPFLDKGNFSCSGSGNTCKKEDLTFLERRPALFWKFRDGIMKAHNGENYQKEVNVYQVDFEKLL